MIYLSYIQLFKQLNAAIHWRNFVAKCGGTAWCETNIFIQLIQKWSFINTDYQSCFPGVLKATLTTFCFILFNIKF